MNYKEFRKLFPTEEKAIKYFIKIRYSEGIVCPHCGSHKVYPRSESPRAYSCNGCDNSFSVFKGTIFEKSETSLITWFYAINMFLNAKKGISACQLQRDTGVTYKTAWRMLKQIRLAMGNEEMKEFMNAVVEMDETYVGGKPRKENKTDDDDDKHNKRGRGTKKTPVVGVINRDTKQAYCKVALPDEDGKKLTGKQLLSVLEEVCKNDNIIVTDEFKGYNILKTKENLLHYIVNHSEGDFSDKKGIHTNSIESFWATLKRGIYGIYHHVSVDYLQNYVNEFCFRYNNRHSNMFDMVLSQAVLV